MDWPQITWIVLAAIGLGIDLSRDGREKEGRHNFIATLIGTGLMAWLLWAGGFFGGGNG